MATQLDVCNAALAMAQQKRIDSAEFATPTQPRTTEVKAQFEFALRELLRQHNWRWAKTRVALVEGTAPDFGWAHSFALPDDFVTLISLNEEDAYDFLEYYEIEGANLLTDETTAEIVYIYYPAEEDIDDFCNLIDPLAMTAFITLLASKICTATTEGQEKTSQLLNRYYQFELPRARARAANEGRRPIVDSDSRWLASRWQSTNG